ncbi:hypothetical protein F5X99DRAFT_413304 [Biscogniauxia marginata]|nr:hypothetical protein F5X99DRAFT_413304 [Biscogniauxia marginata]
MSEPSDRLVEEGHNGDCPCSIQRAQILIRRIWNSPAARRAPAPASYPAISSIPRISPKRLALAAADKSPELAPNTVLYLAYGSNLCAETFLGFRGIRPLGQINVSAPAFDLTFDLPGLPYLEPCFANTAPRKIPKPPIPGDPPKFPPGLHYGDVDVGDASATSLLLPPALPRRGPTWSRGLYGVVYEVTPEDYAKIVATEGGGASYQDVLTPCVALPPALHIPEKPPIPELPRPFLAHTLYAPRLPDAPPPDGDDDNDDDARPRGKKGWARGLLLPVRRPSPDYAQPSPRYLKLIRDGAREHRLPDEYQAYLSALSAYRATTLRQELGRLLFLVLALPPLVVVLVLSRVLTDENGNVPPRLAVAATVVLNLVWAAYDVVFKPVFGDGERTVDEDEDVEGAWAGAVDEGGPEKSGGGLIS